MVLYVPHWSSAHARWAHLHGIASRREHWPRTVRTVGRRELDKRMKRGPERELRPPFHRVVSGGVLLSHPVPRAVPSALRGLASGFGMGPGVSLSP